MPASVQKSVKFICNDIVRDGGHKATEKRVGRLGDLQTAHTVWSGSSSCPHAPSVVLCQNGLFTRLDLDEMDLDLFASNAVKTNGLSLAGMAGFNA